MNEEVEIEIEKPPFGEPAVFQEEGVKIVSKHGKSPEQQENGVEIVGGTRPTDNVKRLNKGQR